MNNIKIPYFIKSALKKAKRKGNDFIAAQDAKEKIYIDESANRAPMVKSQFLGLMFLGGFCLIGIKLGYLTLFRPFDLARSSARAETQKQNERADIVDRNGTLLATNIASYALYANPKEVWDARETAQAIRTIFPELNESELINKLSSRKSMVWIKRRLTPQQKQAIWDLGQAGLAFETESRRIYPNGSLAGHLMGGVNGEGNGIMGLENSYQKQLIAQGAAPIRTTIDAKVQYVVETELNETAAKYRAISGAAVIMNIKNGEIIGAASYPALNPNKFGENSLDQQRNNYLSNTFEMGSTFKAFTFAAALNDEKINANSQFDVSRGLKFGDHEISDLHASGKMLSAREVLEHSSNIGTVLISRLVGRDRLREFFTNLHLVETVSGGLYGASRPETPNHWSQVNAATASFGHGIKVSPLAVIAAYAAITNGGTYIEPTFIIRPPNSPIKTNQVISPDASKKILGLLRDVVTNGTGKAADSPVYPMAGKTGTAEIYSKNLKAYDKNRRVSSFAGVFPAHQPQYAIIFLLNEPKAINGIAATAGIVAAPSVQKIVTRIGPILGIEPLETIAANETSANEGANIVSVPQTKTKPALISVGAR